MTYKVIDLFAGIGGFSKGMEAAGFETILFCEQDKWCQKNLRKHWPKIPINDDICTIDGTKIREEYGNKIIITGGFPCQDISIGGAQKGIINGKRSSLWKEYGRLINEIKPEYAIIENVERLRKNGLGIVLNDLARIGYDAEWGVIRADWVGYPHTRQRLFIIAYPRGQRQHKRTGEERHIQIDEEWSSQDSKKVRSQCESESIKVCPILSRGTFERIRDTYPCEKSTVLGLRRVTNGVPEGLDETSRKRRIKQLGNSVIPRITEIIGRAILEKDLTSK